MFDICFFNNASLEEVSFTIQHAGRLLPNGLLAMDPGASLENRRRALLAARQGKKLLLSAADLRAAEELKYSLLEGGAKKDAWYIQLNQLLALQLRLAREIPAVNSLLIYFEQLQDGRLCMHLPLNTEDDNAPRELFVLFPHGYGTTEDTGLEAMYVTPETALRLDMPIAPSDTIQTVACLNLINPAAPAMPEADDPAAVEAQPLPEPQPEALPEPQPEALPEPQPEVLPEPLPEPQPEAQPLPEPQPTNDCWWLI